MIELNESLLIGKGSERMVYQHPENPELCIKIRYRIKRKRDESEREWIYAQELKHQGYIPFALPIEWVETNLGRGLVCPIIRDDNGQLSPFITDIQDRAVLAPLFDDLRQQLEASALSVTDLATRNIVVQTQNGRPRLVLIDGFGFTNEFLRYLFKITSFVTRIQTRRRIINLKERFLSYGKAK